MSWWSISRAARYSALAVLADLYGRHIIRVLRHPGRYWEWSLLFAAMFIAVIAAGLLIKRRLETALSTGD